MKKLRQPLKLFLFNNARYSASLSSSPSSAAAAAVREASAHLFSPPSFSAESQYLLHRFVLHSWRSAGAACCPSLWKQIAVAKTHSSIGLQSLLGLGSLKVSLQRKNFDPFRRFSSPRSFWSNLMPTPDGAVLSLIGANAAVFILWRIADPTFMRKHFMISLDNVKSGRLHTLLTSAFSQRDIDHIFSNMLCLYFFGTSIAKLFGAEFLLKLYVAGALSGSVFFLIHNAFIASKGKQGYDSSRIYGLGASGAVNSTILFYVFLFPKRIIYVNFFIPVPAILLGASFIVYDLWLVKKGDERVSGSAHLGGAFVAALAFARIKGWIPW